MSTAIAASKNRSDVIQQMPSWVRVEGVDTILAEKHDTPLVSINIAFSFGSYSNPSDKGGLANFFGDMLLRGTKTRTREEIENELDFLGANLKVDTGYHSTMVRGQVLRRNLDRLLALITDILTASIFPEKEVLKVRDELISELNIRLEDDTSVARVHFMEALFAGHPYGRDQMGSITSLKSITRDDLVRSFRDHIHRSGIMIGAGGDLDRPAFDAIVRALATSLPVGRDAPNQVAFHRELHGRKVILVDKPERTQTQFFLGHPGISATDPDYFPLMVFSTAFAGHMFQAKYLQEIRVKRGWAYGAYGRLDARRDGGAFFLHTYPAVKDTLPALELSLQMLGDAAEKGLSDDDLTFAKNYLVRSFPFLIDTPEKIVDERIVARFVGYSDDYLETYISKIMAVTPQQARAVAKKHLNAKDLDIVVLCTAKDFKDTIGKAVGAASVEVVPFDRL
ncbi:MAG TPA: pitrilysin family protein [Bdellovibrionota bacterium]|nr:pitrilysin family protein [Bdellovibrionota bacterium]